MGAGEEGSPVGERSAELAAGRDGMRTYAVIGILRPGLDKEDRVDGSAIS
jgi:hypothetical protein